MNRMGPLSIITVAAGKAQLSGYSNWAVGERTIEVTSGSPEVGEGGSCFVISTSNSSLRRDRNCSL